MISGLYLLHNGFVSFGFFLPICIEYWESNSRAHSASRCGPFCSTFYLKVETNCSKDCH